MQTLAAPCVFQEDIKKSHFSAIAAPVATADDAMAFVAAHRISHATHNCWAYRIGQLYRYSDDGEPGGTAGRPILQAIDGQHLDRVVVLVVRWFGGVKLGTGGLVRAYGGCAARCLQAGEYLDLIATTQVRCQCGFAELSVIRSRAAQAGARVLSEDFDSTGVILMIDVPDHALESLAGIVADVTRGRAEWSVVCPE